MDRSSGKVCPLVLLLGDTAVSGWLLPVGGVPGTGEGPRGFAAEGSRLTQEPSSLRSPVAPM